MNEQQFLNETSIEKPLTNNELFEIIARLMKNKQFLIEIASACDEAYRLKEITKSEKQGDQIEDWLQKPLFSDEEKQILQTTESLTPEQQQVYNSAQKKLAKNLAGFYALCEGLGIIAEDNKNNQYCCQQTLTAITKDKDPRKTRILMSRLAHLSWMAGQPYQGRETRSVVIPWDLLSSEEQEKDNVQITTAAKVLLENILK